MGSGTWKVEGIPVEDGTVWWFLLKLTSGFTLALIWKPITLKKLSCRYNKLFSFALGLNRLVDIMRPRGIVNAYAFFVKRSWEKEKKKSDSKFINFILFSKHCSSEWNSLSEQKKNVYRELAEKDRARYRKEMENYIPCITRRRKRKKDPNSPKRPISAFLLFSSDMRERIRSENPHITQKQIVQQLGRLWKQLDPSDKAKYLELARIDRLRYYREVAAYSSQKRRKLN